MHMSFVEKITDVALGCKEEVTGSGYDFDTQEAVVKDPSRSARQQAILQDCEGGCCYSHL